MRMKESNLVAHARTELVAIGMIKDGPGEGPNKWMTDSIIALVELFAQQGHSGGSASYCINAFKKLAEYEPLGPLSGNDDEWVEFADGIFQNKRCHHVFKEDGQAYDGEGIIFRDKDGSCFTGIDSRVTITFPYTPTHRYVDVCEHRKHMTDYCAPCGRINGGG